MVRVRVDLAYDGGPFAGFARQPEQDTVQGTLEGALSRLTGQACDTTCAGRTDRGVHALAQVVHLDVEPTARAAAFLADPEATRQRLDQLVGDAISVLAVREVGDDFDARFSATERGYRYRLVERGPVDPRLRGLRWVVGDDLDVPAMRAGARLLVGEHDFASFCRKAPGRHTVRRLDELTVARADGPAGPEVHLRLRGPAFCHQMVRSITGCLVEVGRGRRPPAWVGEVLEARDRSRGVQVAPAAGLTLERVAYGRRWPAAPPPALRHHLGG